MDRRSFLTGLGAGVAMTGCKSLFGPAPRHRSDYAGVRVGAITYSYAQMPVFPRGCTKGFILASGIGSVEMMDRDFERDIGVKFRDIPAGKLTKGQKVAISQWRETAEMGPLEDFRRAYEAAGIGMHIVKFGDLGFPWMYSWKEAEYMFKAARALGAKAITREVPDPKDWAAFKPTAAKLDALARAYDIDIAFHNHAQIAANTYNGALLGYSDHFKINFDIGNYVAANDDDPLPLVKKYADRLCSIHVKDRTRKNGPEKNFGTGDTPLAGLFDLLKRENLDIPCDIEMEIPVRPGTDAVEMTRECNLWCRNRLVEGSTLVIRSM